MSPTLKRKECVFCGCDDCKISNEHAWPQWARKLVAPPGASTVKSFPDVIAGIRRVQFQSHDDMGLTVNSVCKHRCNSGWMHDLESQIEPLLTAAIQSGQPLTLNGFQQSLITQWALKTTMVFEFTRRDREPFYTFHERDRLRRAILAPTILRTMVWIGHYSGPYMSLSRGARIGFDLEVGDHVIPTNAHAGCITLGRFLFQTLTIRLPRELGGTVECHFDEFWRLLRRDHSRMYSLRVIGRSSS